MHDQLRFQGRSFVKFFARPPLRGEIFASLLYPAVYGLAERVGFGPLLGVENKELNGFGLPYDPRDPHKSPGRDTY
jgi:hypothetical protein